MDGVRDDVKDDIRLFFIFSEGDKSHPFNDGIARRGVEHYLLFGMGFKIVLIAFGKSIKSLFDTVVYDRRKGLGADDMLRCQGTVFKDIVQVLKF